MVRFQFANCSWSTMESLTCESDWDKWSTVALWRDLPATQCMRHRCIDRLLYMGSGFTSIRYDLIEHTNMQLKANWMLYFDFMMTIVWISICIYLQFECSCWIDRYIYIYVYIYIYACFQLFTQGIYQYKQNRLYMDSFRGTWPSRATRLLFAHVLSLKESKSFSSTGTAP